MMKNSSKVMCILGCALLVGVLVMNVSNANVTSGVTIGVKPPTHVARLKNIYIGSGSAFAEMYAGGDKEFNIKNGLVVNNGIYGLGFGVQGIVIGGGNENEISADNAGIVGGRLNKVSAESSVIGGGSGNIVSGQKSVIAGGHGNSAGDKGVVIGGYKNYVSGEGVVLGGKSNSSQGSGNLVLGVGVTLTKNLSFVWNDKGYYNSSIDYPAAYIGTSKGVLLGTYQAKPGVNLVVNGAVFLGNSDAENGLGGEIMVKNGCFYTYDGELWHVLGGESEKNCSDVDDLATTCRFGEVKVQQGDTVKAYTESYGSCSPIILTCGGDGKLYNGSMPITNYFPYCYKIGDNFEDDGFTLDDLGDGYGNGIENLNVNIDRNGDGKCDINCDTNGDGIPDTDIDTNGDGIPDLNIDTNGDGIPDTNIDTNGDGRCDVNCDTNGDEIPDINLDVDGDGTSDIDIDTNGDGIPDVNLDTNRDGIPDVNIDTNRDGIPDINMDKDRDGKCDVNCDTDGDGFSDTNIDTDGDKIPDINIDTDGDGFPDINIDTDGDGFPDINIDTDGDGFADINIDTNGDRIPDTNIDRNGDKIPDTNIDTNGDGKCDINCDTNGDEILDTNTDGDDENGCDAGYYRSASDKCVLTLPGTYSEKGKKNYVQCPKGTHSNAGASSISECWPYEDLDVYILGQDGNTVSYSLMDRNLGAKAVYNQDADNPNVDSFGYNYQWGNNYGFEPCTTYHCNSLPNGETTSATKVEISTSDVPSKYASNVLVTVVPWMNSCSCGVLSCSCSDKVKNLWGGVTNTNVARQGPCPSGYHVPSSSELNTLLNSWGTALNKKKGTVSLGGIYYQDAGEQFAYDFLLPYGGYRELRSLQMEGDGTYGIHTSDYIGSQWSASSLFFGNLRGNREYNRIYNSHGLLNYGWPVRCLKNSNNNQVTIHSDGGVGAVVSVVGGKIKSLGTPSKENYTFQGWYLNSSFTQRVELGDKAPQTLYAKWSSN